MRLLRTGVRKLSSIVMPGGWQDELDEVVVGEMVQALREGAVLPPVVLDQADRLVAGRNRYEAHRRAGIKEIRADGVHFDDELEARILTVRENLHRKRLTSDQVDLFTAHLVGLTAERISRKPFPKKEGAGRPVEPRAEAVREVAAQEKVTPRAIEQRIARAEGKAPERRAQFEPADVEDLPGDRPGASAEGALKALAVGLRKLEKHLAALDVAHYHQHAVSVHFRRLQQAVFEASRGASGEEESQRPAGSPDDPCEGIGGDDQLGDPSASPAPVAHVDERSTFTQPMRTPPQKRLNVVDQDGKPILPDDETA